MKLQPLDPEERERLKLLREEKFQNSYNDYLVNCLSSDLKFFKAVKLTELQKSDLKKFLLSTRLPNSFDYDSEYDEYITFEKRLSYALELYFTQDILPKKNKIYLLIFKLFNGHKKLHNECISFSCKIIQTLENNEKNEFWNKALNDPDLD